MTKRKSKRTSDTPFAQFEALERTLDQLGAVTAAKFPTWQKLVDAKNAGIGPHRDIYEFAMLDFISARFVQGRIMREENCSQRKAVILLHRYKVIMGYKKARARK